MSTTLGKKNLCSCIFLCIYYVYEIKDAFSQTGLSVDGDSQGVERLLGALSAHMWPGMVLKSGDKVAEPSLHEREGLNLRLYLVIP